MNRIVIGFVKELMPKKIFKWAGYKSAPIQMLTKAFKEIINEDHLPKFSGDIKVWSKWCKQKLNWEMWGISQIWWGYGILIIVSEHVTNGIMKMSSCLWRQGDKIRNTKKWEAFLRSNGNTDPCVGKCVAFPTHKWSITIWWCLFKWRDKRRKTNIYCKDVYHFYFCPPTAIGLPLVDINSFHMYWKTCGNEIIKFFDLNLKLVQLKRIIFVFLGCGQSRHTSH